MVRDQALARSVAFLCLVAAVLILAGQGGGNLQSGWRGFDQLTLPGIRQSQGSGSVAQTQRYLIVRLEQRRVDLYHRDQVQTSYPIAVGQEGWETPTGRFTINQMQRNPAWQHPLTGLVVPPGPENPLGARWIGFESKGSSAIGFHGTNEEDLIGQAVSHGCIRMRNPDIIALYDQVTEGMLVIVQP